MNCWTRAENLKPYHYRKIGKLVIMWCKKEIAYKKHKGLPKIMFWYNDKNSDTYASYNDVDNIIEIYTKSIEREKHTVSFIIRTIIHEYAHYTQNLNKYKKLYLQHGYLKHPQEIEARKFECMWNECYKKIKNNLPKIKSK